MEADPIRLESGDVIATGPDRQPDDGSLASAAAITPRRPPAGFVAYNPGLSLIEKPFMEIRPAMVASRAQAAALPLIQDFLDNAVSTDLAATGLSSSDDAI